MQPLRILESEKNSLQVELAPSEELIVFPSFCAESRFRYTLARDLLVPRMLAGRWAECRYTAGNETRSVQLHGPETHGHFHLLRIPKGRSMFIRMGSLAAYRFSEGGRFLTARGLLSPARWFSVTAFAVVAQGPAEIVLYGDDLVVSEMLERPRCFADRMVAFDAHVPFRVRGLRQEGTAGSILDALSSVVEASFQRATTLGRRTTIDGGRPPSLVWKALRLVLGGLILGSVVERLIFSRWLWSWIS